jgi:hypothetical protein
VEHLYSKGVALYASFSISVLFMAASFLIHFRKLKFNHAQKVSLSDITSPKDAYLGMLTPLQIGMKAGLAGSSFGSEFLLIITYLEDDPSLAAGIITFRLLHMVVTGMFLAILFGNVSVAKWLDEKGVMKGAPHLRELMNEKFSRANVPFVMTTILLSMIDCPMLQFLPWNDSPMYRESGGFPSQTLMKWTLDTDALQATVNVIIQIYSLSARVSLNIQERALSGLNLAFSLIGVVSALITLCLKTALLEGVADTDDNANNRQNNEQEFGLDEVPYPISDSSEPTRKISRPSAIEIGALYQLSEYESGTSRYTENPMLGSSENATKDEAPGLVGKSNKKECEIAELRRVIENMSSENEQMRLENEQMRREMENLRTGHSEEETTNEQPQI